jgi:DNA topoisomerase VI subunit A
MMAGSVLKPLSRDDALHEIEALVRDTLCKIKHEHGLHVTDLPLLSRKRENEVAGSTLQLDGVVAGRTNSRSSSSRRQVAQLWVIISTIHECLAAGKKMSQREMWYRLKTTKLFASPKQVNDRVMEVRSGSTDVAHSTHHSLHMCLSTTGVLGALLP